MKCIIYIIDLKVLSESFHTNTIKNKDISWRGHTYASKYIK